MGLSGVCARFGFAFASTYNGGGGLDVGRVIGSAGYAVDCCLLDFDGDWGWCGFKALLGMGSAKELCGLESSLRSGYKLGSGFYGLTIGKGN
ncbi:hypothetical protein CFP56_044180 [Quercus suber]|uniref:Uncharacterized protein n=1 Tax=Quercus suber TaxID=58331 RepID=A0AAW0IPC6_QUESU